MRQPKEESADGRQRPSRLVLESDKRSLVVHLFLGDLGVRVHVGQVGLQNKRATGQQGNRA